MLTLITLKVLSVIEPLLANANKTEADMLTDWRNRPQSYLAIVLFATTDVNRENSLKCIAILVKISSGYPVQCRIYTKDKISFLLTMHRHSCYGNDVYTEAHVIPRLNWRLPGKQHSWCHSLLEPRGGDKWTFSFQTGFSVLTVWVEPKIKKVRWKTILFCSQEN